MNRLRELIRYIVEHRPGCGRTMMVKYLYLADLGSRRFLGRPLSPLQYRLDFHGPFDPEIVRELDQAVADGSLRLETIRLDDEARGYFYASAAPSLSFSF